MNAVDNLTERLRKEIARHGGVKHPIGLHADPKNGLRGWCGIGPIDWGRSAESWMDVRVGDRYREVNDALYRACVEIGVEFINMA